MAPADNQHVSLFWFANNGLVPVFICMDSDFEVYS